MQEYQFYNLLDFITDDDFCEWVLNPNHAINEFWTSWLKANPETTDLIDQARNEVIQLSKASSHPMTTELISSTWESIARQKKSIPINRFGLSRNKWMSIAASFALLCMAFYLVTKGNFVSDQPVFLSDTKVSNWIEYTNETSAVWRIELYDGSVVTLEPQSYLKYPDKFGGISRNVLLKGEAFFEIARDTAKPFYVFANKAVIRVLGTSFFVKAHEDQEKIEVEVKTGKVAVYERSEIIKRKKEKTLVLKPIIATPNQKVIYTVSDNKMVKRLTSRPTLIKPLNTLPKLKFDSSPAYKIFQALEEAYGVKIIMNDLNNFKCLLSTTLTEQTLYEKLEILCLSIGITYQEVAGNILLKGKCQ